MRLTIIGVGTDPEEIWYGTRCAEPMRARYRLLFIAIICMVPVTVAACEPILPLTQLLGGSGIGGPILLTQSVVLLAAAVTIKCGAFALLERRLRWPQAVLFMLLANIFSTIPGVLVAAITGSIGGAFLALPIVFALAIMAAQRLRHRFGARARPWLVGVAAVFGFVLFFYFSVVSFYIAQEAFIGP